MPCDGFVEPDLRPSVGERLARMPAWALNRKVVHPEIFLSLSNPLTMPGL
jgi:hypothetical protein